MHVLNTQEIQDWLWKWVASLSIGSQSNRVDRSFVAIVILGILVTMNMWRYRARHAWEVLRRKDYTFVAARNSTTRYCRSGSQIMARVIVLGRLLLPSSTFGDGQAYSYCQLSASVLNLSCISRLSSIVYRSYLALLFGWLLCLWMIWPPNKKTLTGLII